MQKFKKVLVVRNYVLNPSFSIDLSDQPIRPPPTQMLPILSIVLDESIPTCLRRKP